MARSAATVTGQRRDLGHLARMALGAGFLFGLHG
jgi:hypothetical protein